MHIQSLPGGALVGIKDLARRFTEGEVRIASALRELERHGYLSRSKEHLPGGRLITRTVSYNRPGAVPLPERDLPPPPPPPPPPPAPEPAAPEAAPELPAPVPAPVPAVPAPEEVIPSRRKAAKALLGQLRRIDQRLLLGERDIERLAPGVEAWLERGAAPQAVTAALIANLPTPPHNPAGLIAYRLAHQLPPVLEPVHREFSFVPPDPFQTCERCDRAFRSPTRGTCRGCAEEAAA
ncbi:helix-turn-helix domain-containing protein [Streptomyces sp. ISL-44]|uniref:helix-turn-helix domain-containing protein n=1 Tax=Streptomyces sp. ISL-44 TaxID=2819184 RepID=UPI0027E3198F|nr:helix-turn-helix domain-containing protein [Streptomyces sp. ISL-44]